MTRTIRAKHLHRVIKYQLYSAIFITLSTTVECHLLVAGRQFVRSQIQWSLKHVDFTNQTTKILYSQSKYPVLQYKAFGRFCFLGHLCSQGRNYYFINSAVKCILLLSVFFHIFMGKTNRNLKFINILAGVPNKKIDEH